MNTESSMITNFMKAETGFITHMQSPLCRMLLKMKNIITVIAASMLLIIPSMVSAQGNLLITPRRVVFEGGKKMQELNLANIGKDSARYVLSMVEMRMKEDGSFERIATPDSGQNFASSYIRFFPRSVVLAPNESQLVKVQVSKTDQLPAGEYRSHIYFRAERDDKPLGEIEAVVDSGSISISLVPIFGITIPIIVRVGEVSAEVKLTDAEFMQKDTLMVLSMNMHRSGNKSVYGNIKVEHVAENGMTTIVGQANGISVYTPNKMRHFEMKINKVVGIDFKRGKLRVTYGTDSDVKQDVMAETEVSLH